jgi:RNA polymerase sigma-70 factor (ECF subfamily)
MLSIQPVSLSHRLGFVRHSYVGARRGNVTVDEHDWLAERFEANRTHLRAVASRMLGSRSEADDAVQDAWLRFSRSDTGGVENLRGWLTTIVARSCLDMLRSRTSRREEPFGADLPDPIVSQQDGSDPEHEALLADSVGPAMLVVLETLAPAERLAFVLHDMFAVPFDEIAHIVGRSPAAARQLASRARRRVQGAATVPDVDLTHQREVVDAFLAASRDGDLDALVALLDPDVVLRADRSAVPGGASREVRGAPTVAKQALTFSRRRARAAQPALVNGAVGIVVAPHGRLFAVLGFTITRGKIVEIDVIADPEHLHQLDLAVLDV